MNNDYLLMIFVKNPELGKVKTRLASTIGDGKALEIYKTLLAHTCTIANFIVFDKAVFYLENIAHNDLWHNEKFQKYLQNGEDLGERMLNAFTFAFAVGYKRVVIIGSDCIQLTPKIINEAFEMINTNDVVIGPAKDGGYYLLGMNKLYLELFHNKIWSSENVLLDTLIDLKKMNVSYKLLETLSDVDREEDLGELKKLIGNT
ncbi:MAG: glycosyltransferase [Bacteroidetes bacterium]|nr:MAG: glycosyltransferase [Bacteroidota bacterium]